MSAAGTAQPEEIMKRERPLTQPYADSVSDAAHKKTRVAQKLGTAMSHNAAAKAHDLAATAQFSGLRASEHREQAKLHRRRVQSLKKRK